MNIEIGLLIPRSVLYPMLSQYLVRGIKLAFKAKGINAAFRVEDIGKGDKTEDVLGKANSLLVNDVELCFAMIGGNSLAQLSDVFSQSGVPLIVLDAGAKINLNEEFTPSATTFIHSLKMWQSLYVLGEFAGNKYKKIVSSSSLFDSGFQLGLAFSLGLEKTKGETVGYHNTQQFTEDDFKVRLKNTISEGQPKALLCLYSGNEADEFYSKSILKGYDGGLPILTTPLGLGTGKIELDSITVVSTWFEGIETDENKEFIEAYVKKHKKNPDIFAALAYEAAYTVAKIAEAKDDWDGEEISELLKSTKHRGIRGKFSYVETGETTDFPIYINEPDNGLKPIEFASAESIRSEEKDQISSGWLNPYPCS